MRARRPRPQPFRNSQLCNCFLPYRAKTSPRKAFNNSHTHPASRAGLCLTRLRATRPAQRGGLRGVARTTPPYSADCLRTFFSTTVKSIRLVSMTAKKPIFNLLPLSSPTSSLHPHYIPSLSGGFSPTLYSSLSSSCPDSIPPLRGGAGEVFSSPVPGVLFFTYFFPLKPEALGTLVPKVIITESPPKILSL